MELLGATTEEIEGLVAGLGEPSYRAKQLVEWVYRKGVDSFSAMTNLSAEFRRKLDSVSSITRGRIITRSSSPDGATKYLLEFADGQRIESVLLPYANSSGTDTPVCLTSACTDRSVCATGRLTVCVSTQVGCAAGCAFCATATGGFVRNLSSGEIIDQVLTLQSDGGRRVTNVVFMGMGEPLLNYDAVLSAVKLLNSQVGISMRKMTISTVGITSRIRRLQSEKLQLTLAISLHAPDDDLRRQIIPLAAKYPLDNLIKACRDYANATGRRVTYEYLMLAGINDSAVHASRLAELLSGSLANVNLIPYNTVCEKDYRRPPSSVVNAFRAVLEEHGIETTQRFERGHAAAAACGQLRAGI